MSSLALLPRSRTFRGGTRLRICESTVAQLLRDHREGWIGHAVQREVRLQCGAGRPWTSATRASASTRLDRMTRTVTALTARVDTPLRRIWSRFAGHAVKDRPRRSAVLRIHESTTHLNVPDIVPMACKRHPLLSAEVQRLGFVRLTNE